MFSFSPDYSLGPPNTKIMVVHGSHIFEFTFFNTRLLILGFVVNFQTLKFTTLSRVTTSNAFWKLNMADITFKCKILYFVPKT